MFQYPKRLLVTRTFAIVYFTIAEFVSVSEKIIGHLRVALKNVNDFTF